MRVGLFDRLFRRRVSRAADDPIAMMIGQLREACVEADMRHISADFFCCFRDEASAGAAAHARYRTVVEIADQRYVVQATCILDLDETLVRRHVAWFEELARRHGGEYDGWGALPTTVA